MEPKTELLVFNRKEITVIITLLVLVAMFSFTLGLRLGKTLGGQKAEHVETAPLTEKKATAAADHGADAHSTPADETKAETNPSASTGAAAESEDSASKSPAKAAEDVADQEFASETKREKVGMAKAVPMALPNQKKTEAGESGRFTLQVGSHRTVAEAAEQVTTLKRLELDAFYLEAKVKGKGTWYRVGVGTFPTKEAAEKAGAKLKAAKGLPSYIVQRITE